MALSANQTRNYVKRTDVEALPVQASSIVYVGSAVSIDTGGEVGPLATGDAGFYGFALEKVDNSSGSAGDVNVEVVTAGKVELTITGLNDNDDIGDKVYATDDNTFTLTASGAKAIGKVAQITSLTNNKAIVRFSSLGHEHWND